MSFISWILVSNLLLYFMDETVLGISFRQLRSSDMTTSLSDDLEDVTFKDDTHYIPVKILSKKGIVEKHPNDFDFNPDAYLFLSEPVKIKASKKSHPIVEGRLIMASGTKKKNLNNYAVHGYPFKPIGDLLPGNYENEETSTSDNESDLTVEPEHVLEETLVETKEESLETESTTEIDPFEIVDNEELSDKLASEIANEIIKELENDIPENFLTEDGKNIITLPENSVVEYNDENVIVTSTFPTKIIDGDVFEDNITTDESLVNQIDSSNKSSVRVNRFIESSQKTHPVDRKPSILDTNTDVEIFFKKLRTKWEKNIPSLSMKKEDENLDVDTTEAMLDTNDINTVTEHSINVFEFLTTVSEKYNDITLKPSKSAENDLLTTTLAPFESVEITTHDPRFHFLIDDKEGSDKTTTDLPITTESTTLSSATETTVTTLPLITTTSLPVKKYKVLKKKKASSDTFNIFKDFTQDDIDVLKSLFKNVARTKKNPRNKRTKEKRSHPDEFWNQLLKKASPRLKGFAHSVINENEDTTTVSPETTTILSTTTDPSLKTTLRSTPPIPETTTITPELVSDDTSNSYDTDMQEATEEEVNNNRIDDTLHSKRAAQNEIHSPFSGLKEKFKMGSHQDHRQPLIQPLPQLNDGNLKKPAWLEKLEQENSEEREQRLEHDLQKMIKFVGILSKIDGFFMDRTKTAVRKLSTLLDDDDQDHGHGRHRKRRNHLYY